jgi:hypothetical protein
MGTEKTDAIAVTSKLIVGVDIAKADFAVATVWCEQHTYSGKTPNNPAECVAFANRMEELQQTCGAETIHLVLEPTGGYELQLVSEAYRRNWRVTLVNPLTVRHWQQGRGKRGKTDRQDAIMLAAFGADKNPPHQQPTDEAAAALDSLLRRQTDLEQLLRSERNRLGQVLLNPHTPQAVQQSIQHMIETPEQECVAIKAAIQLLFANHVKLARQLKQLCSVPAIGKKSAPYLLASSIVFMPKPAAMAPPNNSSPLSASTQSPMTAVHPFTAVRLSPNRATPPCVAGSTFVLWAACVAATICTPSILPFWLAVKPRSSPLLPAHARPSSGLGPFSLRILLLIPLALSMPNSTFIRFAI